MIPRSAHNLLALTVMLAVAVAAVAQQSPTSPVPVPDVTTGLQGVVMQPTPPSFGAGDTSGFFTAPQQTPQVAPPLQPNAVQTIRSTARRQVSIAGQQAFEPILDHEVVTGELPDIGQTVSVEALAVPKPVMEVLDAVAMASGWNIIASKGIAEEQVRFSMKNVTPKQMMEALRFQGIYYDYDPAANLLYVMLDGEFLEREYGAPEHAEFRIEHADVLDMETILSALMSQTGKLISDPRTGLILVWDTQSNLDAMTAAVTQLDVPLEPQVFALNHLSAEDLLDTIESLLSERGLAQADPRTNSIVVTDLPARKRQIGLMLEALDQKLETRTWTLNYADPEILVERLENILPEELGTITVDENTYQVSVTAIPSRIEEIDDIIKSWDVKGRQVQIEAYLVSASTTVMRDLSINWAYFDEISGVPFAIQSGNVQPDYTGGPEGGQRATAGRRPYRAYLRNPITGSRVEELSNTGGREAGVATGNYILDPDFKGNRVAVVLDYLDSTGELSILSRPRVTVRDGQEAIFENTTDRPFQSIGFSNFGGVIDSSSPQESISSRVIPGSVQFVTVGTILRVLPRISAEDNILMDIEAEDSTAEDKTIISADLASTIPQKTQNKAQTQVLVNDGQTIVIGGLRSLSLQDDLEKVPLLGDLPFVGRFFRTTSKDHTDRELAVFITPTIVDENTQPEAKRLAKFEEEATGTMRHSQKNIWGRTADRLAQGKNERSISVGQSGAIHTEGELVTVDDLNREFEALRSAKVKPEVILRVHPSSPVSVSASIQAAAEAAGLEVRLDLSRQPYVPNFDISVPPLVPSSEALSRTVDETPSAEAAIQVESDILPPPIDVTPADPSDAISAPVADERSDLFPRPAIEPHPAQEITVRDAAPAPAAETSPPDPSVTAEAHAPAPSHESADPVVLSAPSPPSVSPRMLATPAQTRLPSPDLMGVPAGDATFTIQVSSFAANNEKVAQAYEAEIERKTGYDLRLVPSGDGKHIRAYVGGFTDRGSANLARQALSKSPFFADCFVKPLNEE